MKPAGGVAAVAVLVLASAGTTGCAARPRTAAPGAITTAPGVTSPDITERDARRRVALIAADSMEGRFTGGAGHVAVTASLAREVAALGLRPGGDSGTYFQYLPFVKRRPAEASLSADGERLELERDFVPWHPGGAPRAFDGATVVFGGNIQDTTKQITAEQATGRFVIMVQNRDNSAGNIRSAHRGERMETAAAIAVVNAPRALSSWASALVRDARPDFVANEDPGESLPAAFAISARAAARLLGREADVDTPLGTLGAVVHGAISWRPETLSVRNVIAVLPGSDPRRSVEYVALGAHSDHLEYRRPPVEHDSLRLFNVLAGKRARELGKSYLTAAERSAIVVDVDSLRARRPPRPDSVYNGADDDASGTAALLEIAEAMATTSEKPARSILFVWHAAEELGLIGSRYFTDHPTVTRDAIVAQLNLDMIGRGGPADLPGGGPRYLQMIGWRRLSSQLGDVIEEVNRRQAVPFLWDLQFDAAGHREQLYCRSDHYNYARYGIPVAFFSTGLHPDYHEVTDEPQYLDFGKLARVAQLVHDAAVSLANRDRRPALDGPLPDPTADCTQ